MKINLPKEKLEEGINLGINLAKCEFSWGSKYVDLGTQKDIAYSVIKLLPVDAQIKFSSYIDFCNGILNYYQNNDIDTFYSILIGMCCQRIHLVNSTSNVNNFAECINLAKSCLLNIPKEVIDDKDALFSMMQKYRDDMNQLVAFVINSSSKIKTNNHNNDISINYIRDVFISYASEDIEFAEKLRVELNKHNISSFMDRYDLPIGEKYPTELVAAIKQCKIFLSVISKSSMSKDNPQAEIQVAFDENIKIYPLKIDNEKNVNNFYYILKLKTPDYFSNFETTINNIKNVLNSIN